MTAQHQVITPPAPSDRDIADDETTTEIDERDVELAPEQSAAPSTGEPVPSPEVGGTFLPDTTSANADQSWQRIQAQFVDDPRKSVGEAHELVGDLMQRIVDAFARERRSLEQQWSKGDDVSTEDLRVCLQRYRGFFSRLLPSVNELEKRGADAT